MPERHDEERTLLDRYAQATSPTQSEVEHALTRTLARIESNRRTPSLPDARRRFVWFAAAGLATLVIASAAFAGARWLKVRSQPSEPSYDAARFERVDIGVDAGAAAPQPGRERTEPIPELPEPGPETVQVELGDVAEVVEVAEPLDHVNPDASTPKPRHRDRTSEDPSEPAEQPAASGAPVADASVLGEESRLLAKVRRALHEGDFESALEWADEHARRHPLGLLTEERLVLEAVAACRGGQLQRGLVAAKQLREQFPGTPTLAKVEQACGEG